MINQIKQIIESSLKEKGVTKYNLQKNEIISCNGLNNFLLRDTTISLQKVKAILDYLGLEVEIKVKDKSNLDNVNEVEPIEVIESDNIIDDIEY